MNEKRNNFTADERLIADEVADDILTVYEEDDDRRYFFLLLFLLICLIFLISSISFAVFETYYNGFNANSIDVGIDTSTGKCTHNCDTDGDGICDKYCDDKKNDDINNNVNKDNDNDKDKDKNNLVKPGTILFSYSEKSNYIDMKNVFPISDSTGMNLMGDKEYFDFNVSVSLIRKTVPVTYEISLLPLEENTISENDIRTNLTEKNKSVSVNSNSVNTFSKLPVSKFNKKARVVYKKTVSSSYNADYVFRMWLSHDAKLDNTIRTFRCKVVVNGYYSD